MENRNELKNASAPTKTSSVLVGFAWVFVGIPLLWGVYQTFEKSLALFK